MIKLDDNRIHAVNVMITISLGQYITLSESIISNNIYQRKRVKNAVTVYNLLKRDLKQGCIIPPIVLAISREDYIAALSTSSDDSLLDYLNSHKEDVVILDGLQRTYTIRDLISELKLANDPDLAKVLENKIRIEVYLGINRLGILYRMLTLNSGQTPMSSRHQIEMIYSDFAKHPIGEIKLIKEVEDKSPAVAHQYKFSDVIDGFTSYLERDYLSIDRMDILDNIKSLEKFSEESNPNIFEDFISLYDKIADRLNTLANDWQYSQEELSLNGRPYFDSVWKLFSRSQTLTGFGAALGKLIDTKEINGIKDLFGIIESIAAETIKEGLNEMLIDLDKVRQDARKIGNDQRLYFFFFFRKLLAKTSDSYLNIIKSAEEAYKHYERETK